MAPYDSDSSDDEFTETNVLLGYASEDADDDTITRLGGRPEWLTPETPPSAALARCKVCKDLMVLLLQLNGELPDRFPGHERRLYVFACRRQSCRRKAGSVRALRGVRVSKEEKEEDTAKVEEQEGPQAPKAEKPADSRDLGSALFGGKTTGLSGTANPFSSGGVSPFAASSGSNPFSTASSSNPFSSTPSKPSAASPPPKQNSLSTLPKTFKEALDLNSDQKPSSSPPPPEPWPQESALPPPYPVSYLSDADYETLDQTPAKIPANARMEVDADDGAAASSSGKDDKEIFESSMDAAFQKFADRVGQNPEQCIRYEFSGTPLLYSRDDEVGKLLGGGYGSGGRMPGCANCGAGRVFEVQMTPQAIVELEADEAGLDGMDWGTIIVGVCERDCRPRTAEVGEDGYLEEWAGVQWEELTTRT